MQRLRIGIDVDGVLANFNKAYREKLIVVSGRDLIPEDFEPMEWDYATSYGYTKEEDAAAWQAIRSSTLFWQSLHSLPAAQDTLDDLDEVIHALYFITTRPGEVVKYQTEMWLRQFLKNPTVLIARTSEDKGLLAKGLGLTHFIDDKPENCLAVKREIPSCAVFLLSYAYNTWADPRFGAYDYRDITRIYSLEEFTRAIWKAEESVIAA